MLVLQRKAGQAIQIGEDIRIVVLAVSGEQVRLGIEAPRHVRVLRDELIEDVRAENERAAAAVSAVSSGGPWLGLR